MLPTVLHRPAGAAARGAALPQRNGRARRTVGWHNGRILSPGVFTLLVLSLLVAAPVFAATDAGVSCVEVEQRLASVQRTLATCQEQARAVGSARDRCLAELDDTERSLEQSTAKAAACVDEKEQQCRDAAVMAASFLQGSARGVGACVPPATEAQIQELLDGWFAVSKALAQLDEYVSGTSDTLPRPAGPTETERHLARVLGVRQGAPLWNRRVLLEAFKLTAPRAWQKTRAQGAPAVEAFFDTLGPLPEAIVTEANGEHPEPPGPAGPPLSAALKLTQAYLHVSRCEERPASRECARARQLVELLDTTGPLQVRRRIEELWSTPCEALGPEAIRAWLQDFPASKREKREEATDELSAAAREKLYLCFLANPEAGPSYRAWVGPRLPAPASLDARTLPLVDSFRTFVKDGGPIDQCSAAVRVMQRLPVSGCRLERPELVAALEAWALAPPPPTTPEGRACERAAALLWNGVAVRFPRTPSEGVQEDADAPRTPVALLRDACDGRQGVGPSLAATLASLARVAQAREENVALAPWRVDAASGRPLELVRLDASATWRAWAGAQARRASACDALGLSPGRCGTCRDRGEGVHGDCDALFALERRWAGFRELALASGAGLGGLLVLGAWGRRLRRARRSFAGPLRAAAEHLGGLGLQATKDPWRFLLPSRHDLLRIELPRTPAWERWGSRACAVLAPGTSGLREADVNHAGGAALREDARVVFLLHPDSATPDLGAVRATLDWAARGGNRAVQVLPLATSRLAWATRDEDLLDLVESTTLRGNPFEVRGPVRSSSQFWNRERLVAGLLTEARAGNWVVVTGLRRFGKSSLALEVARRVTGPSAYVDLAGFHHEVSYGETPAVAVDAILRTLVMRLSDSAAARYPAAVVPPVPAGTLDAPALAAWLRALAGACGTSSGTPPPPMLLVLDEVEQLLTAPPDKLGRALEVLATLTGRLRSALAEPTSPHAGSTVGVALCAAMHPLLWAPLATLGGQSLMGAFPSICVPALDDEGARAMMQGLGARQGIRFEDDALGALVRASHGVPLLLRRLGTSVLELYDADRARHGALGAVRIGAEGATEAVRREEKGGSPLRVWVESEIASADSSAGVLLRALAREPRVPVAALQKLVENQVMERFAASGLTLHLGPVELKRRAQEAASVMVRLLAESKLLQAHGDLTAPDAYSLPDGVLRRILGEGKAP